MFLVKFLPGQKVLFLIIKYYVSDDGHEPYSLIRWGLLIFSMEIVWAKVS